MALMDTNIFQKYFSFISYDMAKHCNCKLNRKRFLCPYRIIKISLSDFYHQSLRIYAGSNNNEKNSE